MASEIRSYEDLDAWQQGIHLSLRLYEVATLLPKWEQYEMSSQIRRAAVSIPSNVAEGHARRKPKPYLNHVHISLGSLAEIVTCPIIANRLGFISAERLANERRETDRVGQLLHGLARSLEERIAKEGSGPRLGLIALALSGWLAALF